MRLRQNLIGHFSKIAAFKPTKKSSLILGFSFLLLAIIFPTVFAQNANQPQLAQQTNSQINPPSTKIEDKSESIKSQGPTETINQTSESSTKTPTKSPAKPNPTQKQNTQSSAGTSTKTQQNTTGSNTIPISHETEKPQPIVSGILGYINQVRAENDLSQLSYNSYLNSAAKSKSQDMLDKDYFAHTNPDGKTDFDFIREAGYSFSFAGSNIAKGAFTEKAVFDAWMNSAGHKANILDPRAREFGYGAVGSYFTMMVGTR